MPGEGKTLLPALPIAFEGKRPTSEHDIPEIGGDTDVVLASLGLAADEIAALRERRVVG